MTSTLLMQHKNQQKKENIIYIYEKGASNAM
jgi:hypothetical protein